MSSALHLDSEHLPPTNPLHPGPKLANLPRDSSQEGSELSKPAN